jgi:hypothetical protein
MSNDEKPGNRLQFLVWGLVILLIVYNLYLGITVRKIGIPGIFEIEFGEKQEARLPPTSPTPSRSPYPSHGPTTTLLPPPPGYGWDEFEVIQYRWYKHPKRGYELMLDKFRLGLSGQENDYFDVRQFPEGQWIQLTNGRGQALPLAIRKDLERIFAKWLP